MTQIILARHGNTPWNKNKIFRGSKDIPLDDQGREEAWALAEWLKDETIHAAYTSPLSRSRDTALAIARHHDLEVIDLPGLADLSYGDWEGVPLKEVKVKYADLYRQWETAPHTVRFPNGETLEELRTRGLAGVEEVELLGPPQAPASPIVAFSFRNPKTCAQDFNIFLNNELPRHFICARCGSHCAIPLHRSRGVKQSLRASFFVYNTESEVRLFCDALGQFLESAA